MVSQISEQLQSNLNSLFQYNTDAILWISIEGNILQSNDAFFHMTQYELVDILQQPYERFVRVLNVQEGAMLANFEEVNYVDARFQLVAKDGTVIDCLMRKTPIVEKGTLTGYFLIMKNMTELDQMAAYYIESELSYRSIAENIHDVLILMDKNKQYLYVSPSSNEMFGFNHTMLDNREAFFNIHEDYVQLTEDYFNKAILYGEAFTIRVKAWHEERQWIWTEIKGKAVYHQNGDFKHMLLVARDITKEKEAEDNLLHYAYHDALTDLPNRRMFVEHMELAKERFKSQQRQFAVMMMDIDDFKYINDQYGHEIGDVVITTFGQRIQQTVGERGFAARLGGDEFVVLVQDQTEEELLMLAQSLNERVREPIAIQQMSLTITTSIGIAKCLYTQSVDSVLGQADEALYAAKRLGKNHFSMYGAK